MTLGQETRWAYSTMITHMDPETHTGKLINQISLKQQHITSLQHFDLMLGCHEEHPSCNKYHSIKFQRFPSRAVERLIFLIALIARLIILIVR